MKESFRRSIVRAVVSESHNTLIVDSSSGPDTRSSSPDSTSVVAALEVRTSIVSCDYGLRVFSRDTPDPLIGFVNSVSTHGPWLLGALGVVGPRCLGSNQP